MVRLQASLSTCFLVVLAIGCAAVDVESDALNGERLQSLATFAWADDAGLAPNASLPEPLDRELRRRVAAELEARGYRRGSVDAAEILVAYDTHTESRDEWHDPYFRTVVFERIEEGHVTLELLAAADLEPLWTGRGQRDLRVLARKTDSLARLHPLDEPQQWELEATLAEILDSVPRRR